MNVVVAMEAEWPDQGAVREMADLLAALLGASVEIRHGSPPGPDDGAVRAVVVGRGGMSSLELLRSVQAVDAPAAVVPPSSEPARVRRVLVPLTPPASRAARLADTIRLAANLDLDIVILHVADPVAVPPFGDQPQHETAAWAHSLLASYLPVDEDHVEVELRVGDPAGQILAVAAEREVDLIVLPWERDLSPGRGRVVLDVIERSPVPVVLLPLAEASPAA